MLRAAFILFLGITFCAAQSGKSLGTALSTLIPGFFIQMKLPVVEGCKGDMI